MAISLDLDFVRSLYPSRCWEYSFFENAGGSFVPNTVIERLTAYMSDNQVQPGAPYAAARLAQQRMDAAHAAMAAMINAAADEVSIGASTSMNVYVLSKALRPLWSEGDEVIVSLQNHEANSMPWRRLAETGIRVIEWPVDPDSGELQPERLDGLLSDRTRLVAFPHVSNITGNINDVKAITAKVHAAGAEVCVDGVAYAPHRYIDVREWDVDYYVFSFYKIFGPHNGCLYGKKEKLLKARGQYHHFIGEEETSKKLNPAGPCHELIACLQGIDDYFRKLAAHHHDRVAEQSPAMMKDVFALITDHEVELAKRFVEFVGATSSIRLIGRNSSGAWERAPTFSVLIDGRSSRECAEILGQQGIGASAGDFYAERLVRALGIDPLDGVLRLSMAHYTSHADVQKLIAAMDALA